MKKIDIRKLVLLAMFTAIIVIMAFTPLGYLRVGAISITFLMIPVVVGAITLGPAFGAILGGVFGITSLIQCFGMDWFGTTLMGINPAFTVILCLLPRILMGWLSGLIYLAIKKIEKKGFWACCAASLSGALLNTIGFTGLLVLFFVSSFFGTSQAFFDSMIAGGVISEASLMAVVGVLITLNALIEAGVCLVVGTAIAFAVKNALDKKGK